MAHAQITYDDAAAGLRGAGLPDWLCNYIVSLYRAFDEGKGAEVTTDVERITGRPARDLIEFARDYAAHFSAA